MASVTSLVKNDWNGGAKVSWRERMEVLPRWCPYAVIILSVFLIRLPTFGNPLLEFDEQLYLLVGDRMLHGHLPYVDMWDRKPIGLFLFYAAVRLLGGNGIVQYQALASLCVAITSCFIWNIARRTVRVVPAFVATLAYVVFLNVLHGTGGQAPVIYNVFTSCAAWAAFSSNDAKNQRKVVLLAMLAMAMMGIAIQFKYTPVIEGLFFGCWFIYRFFSLKMNNFAVLFIALCMIFLALLPTIFALGYYYYVGHINEFVQANFLSVFHRTPFPEATRWNQLKFVMIKPIGLLASLPFALYAQWCSHARGRTGEFWLLAGWIVSALIGFGMLGDFYDFYFITALMPLCIAIAPLINLSRIGFATSCMLILWPVILTPRYYFETKYFQYQSQRLADTVKPFTIKRCLYIYDGPAIIYLLTNSCAPTRYIYPDHLTNPTESTALGVDPVTEEERLLATHPGAIITANRPIIPRVNPATQRLVTLAIQRDYVLVGRIPIFDRVFYAFALKQLHPVPADIHDPQAAYPQ